VKDSEGGPCKNVTSNSKYRAATESPIKAEPIDIPNVEFIPVDGVDIVLPRLRKSIGNIDTLAQSILTFGLLHPITVRKRADRFVLLAGERRLKAFEVLGIKNILARVLPDELSASDSEGSE
jgi:ParB family chromosome partitioning protein